MFFMNEGYKIKKTEASERMQDLINHEWTLACAGCGIEEIK